MAEHSAESGALGHRLDLTVRPAACSCGHARFAGSLTFVRRRHAAHVEEAARVTPPVPHETRGADS